MAKICPMWFFMILDVPTKPLKGFMLQMKGSKWEFIDIKSVIQTEILVCPVYPSNQTITIEARKIKLRITKIVVRRETSVYRRLELSFIVHS